MMHPAFSCATSAAMSSFAESYLGLYLRQQVPVLAAALDHVVEAGVVPDVPLRERKPVPLPVCPGTMSSM